MSPLVLILILILLFGGGGGYYAYGPYGGIGIGGIVLIILLVLALTGARSVTATSLGGSVSRSVAPDSLTFNFACGCFAIQRFLNPVSLGFAARPVLCGVLG
jgi:hypothetical protein